MNLSTIPKPPEREAWLEARKPYFSASDAGVLYNCHPFQTTADVALRKLGHEEPVEENDAMDRGNRLEPVLLDWFADRHGIAVVVPDRLYVCDRLMATLDGEPVGNDEDWIEAKTTSMRWEEPPEHVRWQVVAQAVASGKRRCFVVALDASMRFKEWEITPTEDEKADLLARVTSFMDFISLGLVPEGVELTSDHVQRMHPTPVPGAVVDVAPDVVQAWMDAKAVLSDAEKAEKAARDALCRMIGDAETVAIDGTPVLTWRAQTRASLDAKSLKADHPDLASKYEKTSAFRVLRPTKAA